MAFDMGFDFRGTSGYVTDPAYGVPVLGEAYPHTYTNANGNSCNAGWDIGTLAHNNRSATNDPRIAGMNGIDTNTLTTFTVDLSSGSAPGAGDYAIDIAVGEKAAGTHSDFKVLDNTTALITSGALAIAAGHFIDATLADVTASTTWTGTPVTKTFATTTAVVGIDYSAHGDWWALAHFRLTLVPPAAPTLGASLLLLGLPFIRAGIGIAYSLAVDPLVLHLNGGAVGLQYTAGQKAYTLAVDPMTLHLNLADVGLTLTVPFAYTLAVDPLTLHLNLADVGLAYSPFTPPRALPSTSGRSPYLEYRRHRRMGR